jgi:hypothetical protein
MKTDSNQKRVNVLNNSETTVKWDLQGKFGSF